MISTNSLTGSTGRGVHKVHVECHRHTYHLKRIPINHNAHTTYERSTSLLLFGHSPMPPPSFFFCHAICFAVLFSGLLRLSLLLTAPRPIRPTPRSIRTRASLLLHTPLWSHHLVRLATRLVHEQVGALGSRDWEAEDLAAVYRDVGWQVACLFESTGLVPGSLSAWQKRQRVADVNYIWSSDTTTHSASQE